MLVQSWGGELRLLPALPAAWPTGSIRGIWARSGLKIDLAWAGGRPSEMRIAGPPLSNVRVRAGEEMFDVRLSPGGTYVRKWGAKA